MLKAFSHIRIIKRKNKKTVKVILLVVLKLQLIDSLELVPAKKNQKSVFVKCKIVRLTTINPLKDSRNLKRARTFNLPFRQKFNNQPFSHVLVRKRSFFSSAF